MDEIFGNDEQNQTADLSLGNIAHIYTANEIAMLLAGLGGCIATIVYSVKNIKHSSCCLGVFSCDQRTELPISKDSIIQQSHV
tara:strand:- start:1071 stop:1319 length:249 start_codon:yes stop_codon:yes gene_type:complete